MLTRTRRSACSRSSHLFSWWPAAGALGVAWTVAFGVGPVAADEFPAAIVVPISGPLAAEGRDALAGFRVAVDASPDVSHPPGMEGGDHLGGSDVELAVIDAGGTPGATAAAVRAQGSAGTGIVLVLAPPPGVLAAVQGALRDVDALLIVAGGGPSTSPVGDAQTVVLQPRGGDAENGASFETAFRAAQGRPPTDAATFGYDAGVAVDLAVEAFGFGVRDAARVARLLADTDRFAGSVVATPAATPGSPSSSVAQNPAQRGWIFLGVGATIVVAAGAAIVRARRAARRRELTYGRNGLPGSPGSDV